MALPASPSHIPHLSFIADCNQLSCPSVWLLAFNHSKSSHLFYMLTDKNSPWTLLSVLCTESALTYMRKEENSEIKKPNISICFSFSTVLAAPLDQTWFSPLQTQIWHQDRLYPLTWKSVTILHLFIIIHTYRSNTKLENTHVLLDLPWKK